MQAIVQNICPWAVLGNHWPQAWPVLCTSHSHMSPKHGKAGAALAVLVLAQALIPGLGTLSPSWARNTC